VPPDEQVDGLALDGLVARVLDSYGYEFAVAGTTAERELGYRIRHRAAVAAGWLPEGHGADGLEHDRYDEVALHLVGYLAGEPVSTGRIVLPPSRLPTEDACGLVVEPAGQVADVGRMAVLPEHQSRGHAAFVALLCRLYLEVRQAGCSTACGMMSASARRLVRMFGLTLELLGEDREHWHELRAPVRFSLLLNRDSLGERWPT
jgi:GNAT superfamily N-acetyltransferase